MPPRVPLLYPVTAVIYRLDIAATWSTDPPGDLTTGYDPLLREPVVHRSGDTRTVTRVEKAAIEVPCQHEVQRFEELNATFPGNDEVTQTALVLHRRDLSTLGLIDTATGKCTLKPGDRIDKLKRGSRTVLTFDKNLYVYEVRPRSWGFGPDGYDLEILYTTYRDRAAR